MIDGFIIFFVLLLVVLEAKRGILRAGLDAFGAVVALKAAYSLHTPLANFLKTYISINLASIISPIIIFFFIGFGFFIAASVIYRLTMITFLDVYEQMASCICGLITAGCIVRFILLMVVSFTTNEGIKNAIQDSFFGYQFLTLSLYFEIKQRLLPLTKPGELYL